MRERILRVQYVYSALSELQRRFGLSCAPPRLVGKCCPFSLYPKTLLRGRTRALHPFNPMISQFSRGIIAGGKKRERIPRFSAALISRKSLFIRSYKNGSYDSARAVHSAREWARFYAVVN